MPEHVLTWIEAMRVYNAGMPSWCIPRKGTTAYETVMKIRRGEKRETPQEIISKLERKTVGKDKKEKKSMTISLVEEKKEGKDVRSFFKGDERKKKPEPVKTEIPSTKKVSPKEQEMPPTPLSLKDVYIRRDKSWQWTVWRLDGEVYTQLGDLFYDKTSEHEGGFVQTIPRKRESVNKGLELAYLTPEGNKKTLEPITMLPNTPDYLQPSLIEGLEKLGYKKDIEFENPSEMKTLPKGFEYREGDTTTKQTKKKEKREDSPEVIALLEEKKKLEEKREETTKLRDTKKLAQKDAVKIFGEILERTNEIEAQIRKARLKQSREMKQATEK
jgi:hypothetical protein